MAVVSSEHVAIGGRQVVIGGHQRSSEVIRMSSGIIRGHQEADYLHHR